ncbi:MAG: response regulator [Butyrivibrio sp.]|uniref:response regulator transcription factor n=1 Tax=Butyrivibrio sp. TaxID=28121 RepID=UPI0025F5E7DE|nr:response regulator [Butyrivibrio sp.]MCR5772398.1 response regulator [Butyrivibrio sp.]
MYTILIADDEMIERMVLRKKLIDNFGDRCKIIVAENGREVVEKVKKNVPDLLILDIEMPGMNGLEAAKAIRDMSYDCGIIFLTAFNEFDYARKAISVHALEYLLKPCDEKELVLSVEEAIGASKPQKAAGRIEVLDDSDRSNESTADEILKYIEKHYGEDLSVQVMAEKFAYSEVYFCRLFKQHFGESFISFLTEYRIKKAVELLKTTQLSVKDIGKAVGYEDSNYFTKVFKRVMKCLPSDYRLNM